MPRIAWVYDALDYSDPILREHFHREALGSACQKNVGFEHHHLIGPNIAPNGL